MSPTFSTLLTGFFLLSAASSRAQTLPALPIWQDSFDRTSPADWLIKPVPQKAEIFRSADGRDLILYNGLLKRVFRLTPGVACTDYKNLSNGQQLLRAVAPEARLEINGRVYHVGGLKGQAEKAYLRPEWLDAFTPLAADFKLTAVQVGPLKPLFNWKPKTWAANLKQPSGQTLTFSYEAIAPEIAGLQVQVYYELYDGLPLLVKGLLLENK